MKNFFLLVLMLITTKMLAQNGYVKLRNDSVLVGFLKYYRSIQDGQLGIEYWRTKKDKNPRKISKQVITEYAIKKDTFKIFHQFRPFQDDQIYFELIEGKLLSSGKVNLYVVYNQTYTNSGLMGATGGGLFPAIVSGGFDNQSHIYVLEHQNTGYQRALPFDKEELKVSLVDFFPERYITKYAEVKGKVKYSNIPEFVKLYNSR